MIVSSVELPIEILGDDEDSTISDETAELVARFLLDLVDAEEEEARRMDSPAVKPR